MKLIESPEDFTTPEAICLRNSLNPSMNPRTFYKLSTPFTNGEVKEHVQNVLNFLNLVKQTP